MVRSGIEPSVTSFTKNENNFLLGFIISLLLFVLIRGKGKDPPTPFFLAIGIWM